MRTSTGESESHDGLVPRTDVARSSGDRPRLVWMDLLRGAALVLVLLHHATEITRRHVDGLPAAVGLIDAALTPFRMPAMVFLSGILLAGALGKPWRDYLSGKLRNIGHPYVVWTVVYLLTLRRDWHADGTGGALTLADSLLTAPSPLWFLGFLLLAYLAAYVLRRVPRPLLVLAALALSMAFDAETRPARFLYLFAFFILGDWMASRPEQWRRLLESRVAVAVGGLLAVALATGSVLSVGADRYQAQYALGVLGGVLLLVRGAQAVADQPWTSPLTFVGRHSLIPYVVHYPVMIAAAALLVRVLELQAPVVLVLSVLVTGVLASLVAIVLRLRHPAVALLFSVPRRDGPRRRAPLRLG